MSFCHDNKYYRNSIVTDVLFFIFLLFGENDGLIEEVYSIQQVSGIFHRESPRLEFVLAYIIIIIAHITRDTDRYYKIADWKSKQCSRQINYNDLTRRNYEVLYPQMESGFFSTF